MPAGAFFPGGDRIAQRLKWLSEQAHATSAARKAAEEEIEQIVQEGVKSDLLRGRNENGQPFAALAPSTLKQRKKRGISGTTPFITKGESSSIITSFQTYWQQIGPTTRVLRSHWTVDWLKYHWDGGKHLPKRRPGLTPETMAKVRAAWKRYADFLRSKATG